MKVALYHPWIYLTSGIERSFVELLARSRHDWVLYTHHHSAAGTYPELRSADIRELHPAVSVRRSFGPLVTAASRISRTVLPRSGERALLVSSEGFGDLLAPRATVPVAAYCHTPLKILHDPASRAALVGGSLLKRAAVGGLGAAFERVDRRAWRSYRHVFANSAETVDRIATAGLVPAGPVEVLHPGVDLTRFPPGRQAREPFVLVAGRIMWQKDIELALDALREVDRGCRLVVAGAVDAKSRRYLAALRERAAGLDVEFVVDPSDEELADLYRRATLLVFTARNEDFGIVPLEAMASGLPVLAVDAGGPRETVVHGVTGWLCPRDPAQFAERISFALTADLSQLRAACVARAAEFDWERFTVRIDDVMEQLADG